MQFIFSISFEMHEIVKSSGMVKLYVREKTDVTNVDVTMDYML
jgi:hypothetical protein